MAKWRHSTGPGTQARLEWGLGGSGVSSVQTAGPPHLGRGPNSRTFFFFTFFFKIFIFKYTEMLVTILFSPSYFAIFAPSFSISLQTFFATFALSLYICRPFF